MGFFNRNNKNKQENNNMTFKSNSTDNKEKINLLIQDFARKLNVTIDECYFVQMKIPNWNGGIFAIMHIFDDGISYSAVGTGEIINEDYSQMIIRESPTSTMKIHFDKIITLDVSLNQMSNPDYLLINTSIGVNYVKSLLNENFYDEALNKFNNFKGNGSINEINNLSENNIITDNSKDINPIQKIKDAKELLDLGAISQEEFEEIKLKYIDMI